MSNSAVCPLCAASYVAGEPHTCAALEAVQKQSTLVGATIDGRYEIQSALQTGGMGVIYKARHVVLGKPLAVKVLREAGDEAARKRFLQEAQSASRINHSNIVDISDFGVLPSGLPYLVMEFLEGLTLTQALGEGPLSQGRVCQIGAQIARGLQAVHDQGIIHRDLKPDNIFLLEKEGLHDFVKIVDFGIAKSHSGPRLTQAGMTLGTPEYMSPEQATGSDTDHRVDQYALGCILYELLTGSLPFEGKDAMQTLIKHVTEAVVPPRVRRPDLGISPSLEAVVMRAMAKDRKDRFPSMRDMEQALLSEAERSLPNKRAMAQTVRMGGPIGGSGQMAVPGAGEQSTQMAVPMPGGGMAGGGMASGAMAAGVYGPAAAVAQTVAMVKTEERPAVVPLWQRRKLVVIGASVVVGIVLALVMSLMMGRKEPKIESLPAAGQGGAGVRGAKPVEPAAAARPAAAVRVEQDEPVKAAAQAEDKPAVTDKPPGAAEEEGKPPRRVPKRTTRRGRGGAG